MSVPSAAPTYTQGNRYQAALILSLHTVTSERGRQTAGWGGCQTIKPQRRNIRAAFRVRDCKPRLMEVRGQSGPQQTSNSSSSSMCEPTQRSCEPRRKRMDERSAPSEMARIITDPVTGKCYCRGKVLGKVAQARIEPVVILGFTTQTEDAAR